MYPTIAAVFEHHCKDLKVNDKFVNALTSLMYGFVHKNDEHAEFFGGNLTGVQKVRFLTSDQNDLLIDMLDLDPQAVKKDVFTVPGVNEEWKRSTDVYNLACQWLSHVIFNSSLSQKKKDEGLFAIFMLIHFKLLSSLLQHNFRYPVDPQLAKATFAALSMKFALKRHGSWYKSLEERSKDIYSKSSIHIKTIELFKDTEAIRYMIQDIQNRIRIRIRKIWATMAMVIEQDKRRLSVTGSVSLDGGMSPRDVMRNTSKYTKYAKTIVLSDREFIKQELITLLVRSHLRTMPEAPFIAVLHYFVSQSGRNDPKSVQLLDNTLIYVFEQMSKNPDLGRALKDPDYFLTKLRNIYTSSKSTEPELLGIRALADEIVTSAVKIKTAATIASLKTGLMLYIALRVLSKSTYD